MKFILSATAMLLAGGLAAAGHAQPGSDRVSTVIVYGDDPCPQGAEGEIIVCARRPENDRYRIPEPLRGEGRRSAESWAQQAETLEYVGRTGIQSCSTVGPGGFTGCWAEMIRQSREDRRIDPEGQPVP